jgi:hypothetical protein
MIYLRYPMEGDTYGHKRARNKNSKPFKWPKLAKDIMGSINRVIAVRSN